MAQRRSRIDEEMGESESKENDVVSHCKSTLLHVDIPEDDSDVDDSLTNVKEPIILMEAGESPTFKTPEKDNDGCNVIKRTLSSEIQRVDKELGSLQSEIRRVDESIKNVQAKYYRNDNHKDTLQIKDSIVVSSKHVNEVVEIPETKYNGQQDCRDEKNVHEDEKSSLPIKQKSVHIEDRTAQNSEASAITSSLENRKCDEVTTGEKGGGETKYQDKERDAALFRRFHWMIAIAVCCACLLATIVLFTGNTDTITLGSPVVSELIPPEDLTRQNTNDEIVTFSEKNQPISHKESDDVLRSRRENTVTADVINDVKESKEGLLGKEATNYEENVLKDYPGKNDVLEREHGDAKEEVISDLFRKGIDAIAEGMDVLAEKNKAKINKDHHSNDGENTFDDFAYDTMLVSGGKQVKVKEEKNIQDEEVIVKEQQNKKIDLEGDNVEIKKTKDDRNNNLDNQEEIKNERDYRENNHNHRSVGEELNNRDLLESQYKKVADAADVAHKVDVDSEGDDKRPLEMIYSDSEDDVVVDSILSDSQDAIKIRMDGERNPENNEKGEKLALTKDEVVGGTNFEIVDHEGEASVVKDEGHGEGRATEEAVDNNHDSIIASQWKHFQSISEDEVAVPSSGNDIKDPLVIEANGLVKRTDQQRKLQEMRLNSRRKSKERFLRRVDRDYWRLKARKLAVRIRLEEMGLTPKMMSIKEFVINQANAGCLIGEDGKTCFPTSQRSINLNDEDVIDIQEVLRHEKNKYLRNNQLKVGGKMYDSHMIPPGRGIKVEKKSSTEKTKINKNEENIIDQEQTYKSSKRKEVAENMIESNVLNIVSNILKIPDRIRQNPISAYRYYIRNARVSIPQSKVSHEHPSGSAETRMRDKLKMKTRFNRPETEKRQERSLKSIKDQLNTEKVQIHTKSLRDKLKIKSVYQKELRKLQWELYYATNENVMERKERKIESLLQKMETETEKIESESIKQNSKLDEEYYKEVRRRELAEEKRLREAEERVSVRYDRELKRIQLEQERFLREAEREEQRSLARKASDIRRVELEDERAAIDRERAALDRERAQMKMDLRKKRIEEKHTREITQAAEAELNRLEKAKRIKAAASNVSIKKKLKVQNTYYTKQVRVAVEPELEQVDQIAEEIDASNKELEFKIDDIDAYLAKRQYKTALEIYSRFLVKYPNEERLWFGRALAVNHLAEKNLDKQALLEGVEAYTALLYRPCISEPLFNNALQLSFTRYKYLRRYDKLHEMMDLLHQEYPQRPVVMRKYVMSLMYIRDIAKAKSVIMKQLELNPDDGFMLVHLAHIMYKYERDYAASIPYWKKGIATRDPETIDKRFFLHYGEALQRSGQHSEAHKVYTLGAEYNLFLSADQRSLNNINSLSGHPWWPVKEVGHESTFKVLAPLWKIIRDEVVGVLENNSTDAVFVPQPGDWVTMGEWMHLMLFSKGEQHISNCDHVPKTCRFLQFFPAATVCHRCEIKISLMSPGSHVMPHVGPTNCRIRNELGLIVPPTSWIRVHNVTRTMKEGAWISYDESFEHEIDNKGTSRLLSLTVDTWHPQLTEELKQALYPL